jgi:putative membrane protein
MSTKSSVIFPIILLAGFIAVSIWSVIHPTDYRFWFGEVTPAIVIVIVLIATFNKFRFTGLFYGLLFLSLVCMLIGGHYTYEKVPLFNWIRSWLHLKRNDFDRFGHFFQGIIPAFAIKELFLRLHIIQTRKWLSALAVSCTLAVSSLYEIAEFAVCKIINGDANKLLGMQGDMWDAQWDMLSALSGAVVGLLLLGKVHDKQINEIYEDGSS